MTATKNQKCKIKYIEKVYKTAHETYWAYGTGFEAANYKLNNSALN